MSLLLASAIDVTVVLTAALGLTIVLHRRSAALRHSILAAAIIAATAAPLLEATLPPWHLALPGPSRIVESSPVRFAPGVAPATEAPPATAVATDSIGWSGWLLTVWVAGAFASVAGLLTGLVRLRRLTARCTGAAGRWQEVANEFADTGAWRGVAVLQSPEPSLLVTCGLIRPKIVLPSGTESWSDARRRIVLAHELAHIARRDWATQMVGETLRALYWFHPLVWIVCRRLRQESEYACDDAVIARGVEATDYATHLLEVARHAVGQRAVWAAAPAIAHPSTLERRIAAMLNRDRNRKPLTRRTMVAIACTTVVLTLPVMAMTTSARSTSVNTPGAQLKGPERAVDVRLMKPDVGQARAVVVQPRDGQSRAVVVQPRPGTEPVRADVAPAAQQEPARIWGTLHDPSGARLPGVSLALTDQVVGIEYNAITNGDGAFSFDDLQPATYELTAQLPGFAPVRSVMPIGVGASVERRITMPIGSLQETITVGCARTAQVSAPPAPRVLNPPPLPPPPPPAPSRRVGGVTDAVPLRIGGQIKAPSQIAKVNPICPNHIGVDTVVMLAARVGIDGYLSDIRLVNGAEHKPAPEIVDSAMDAVRLWRYTPTLLNGTPVEANILMTVDYKWQ